jgi:CRP-like cAMP-binding protein
MEKSLALLEPGAYIGEMTILDGTPRSASARADIPTRVLKVSRADLLSLLNAHPHAALHIFLSFMKVLSQRLRQADEELVVLFDVGRLIGDAPGLDDLLHGILARTMAGTRAALGAVFFHNDITNRLEVKEADGEGSVNLLGMKVPVDKGIVAHAVAANRVLKIDNLDTSEFATMPRFGFERPCMLVAPLVRSSKPFGAIMVADCLDNCPFNNANVNIIASVAAQASAAIESALHRQADEAKAQLERHYCQF